MNTVRNTNPFLQSGQPGADSGSNANANAGADRRYQVLAWRLGTTPEQARQLEADGQLDETLQGLQGQQVQRGPGGKRLPGKRSPGGPPPLSGSGSSISSSLASVLSTLGLSSSDYESDTEAYAAAQSAIESRYPADSPQRQALMARLNNAYQSASAASSGSGLNFFA